MDYQPAGLLRTLGAAARVWSSAGYHETNPEWWLALSGGSNVNFNLACCQSPLSSELSEHCLQPLLDQKKPGIIMLAGPGLSTAQTLIDAGWVNVGAQPLMLLSRDDEVRHEDPAVHSLAVEDLASAREVLTHSFSLDEAGAITVIPDTAIQDDSTTVWGLSEGDQLLATVTIVREDGLAVVWSMATRSESQRRGYGRRLLETVLAREFHDGATGSLLNSSKAGERLYRELGFSAVDYLQLWSRPRWVLGAN